MEKAYSRGGGRHMLRSRKCDVVGPNISQSDAQKNRSTTTLRYRSCHTPDEGALRIYASLKTQAICY